MNNIKDFGFALCEHKAIKCEAEEVVRPDALRAMALKYFWLKFLASQTGGSFEDLNSTIFICGNCLIIGNTYGHYLDQTHRIVSLYIGMFHGCERIFANVEVVEDGEPDADNDVISYLVY